VRTLDGECWECGHPVRSDNTTGFCSPCTARLKCSVCDEPSAGVRGRACADCTAVLALLSAVHGNGAREAPPDLAERLERYRGRAAAGVGLFTTEEV
jgi:hypothetical protein